MAQNKLQRFAEIKTFQNVFEYPSGMKGNWKNHFHNSNPIVLELACGKGEYAIGLAELNPNRNYIGVDIKGNRMWVGAKKALNAAMQNVAFLRTQIEKLTDYFAAGEVAEIWITFPDPQLSLSRAKKRLTHPRFLKLYHSILAEDATINLKTDSPDLYLFTKQVISLFDLQLIQDIDDVYGGNVISSELAIQTHYEKLDIAKSNRIHYLRFSLQNPLPENAEEQLKTILFEQTY